jgi:NAD(P)H-flavin reductase
MTPFVVIANRPSAEQLHHLIFDRPPEGYVDPGQFVVATVDGHNPAYFAIASSPGEPLELLVKRQFGAAEALCDLPPGAPVRLSDALGPGFQARATRPSPLVCLVNGSAISAVRPVLRAEIADGLPRPVHLLYGVLSPSHLPFSDELRGWADAGVDVRVVLDTPAAGVDAEVGFVQDVAEAYGLVSPDVAVLLCGVPAMADDARRRYLAAGLDPARILVNY